MPEQECHARAQGAVLWEAAIVGNVALLRRMIAGEALPVDLLPVTFRAGERIDMLSGKVIKGAATESWRAASPRPRGRVSKFPQ
jgi:hypothetical protein